MSLLVHDLVCTQHEHDSTTLEDSRRETFAKTGLLMSDDLTDDTRFVRVLSSLVYTENGTLYQFEVETTDGIYDVTMYNAVTGSVLELLDFRRQ